MMLYEIVPTARGTFRVQHYDPDLKLGPFGSPLFVDGEYDSLEEAQLIMREKLEETESGDYGKK